MSFRISGVMVMFLIKWVVRISVFTHSCPIPRQCRANIHLSIVNGRDRCIIASVFEVKKKEIPPKLKILVQMRCPKGPVYKNHDKESHK